jgi:hypothetical protein
VEPRPLLLRPRTSLLHQPWMIDGDDSGAVAVNEWQRNRSSRTKSVPVSHCSPQIPHDTTHTRTRTAAVESRWLSTSTTARPWLVLLLYRCNSNVRSLSLNMRPQKWSALGDEWRDSHPKLHHSGPKPVPSVTVVTLVLCICLYSYWHPRLFWSSCFYFKQSVRRWILSSVCLRI